MTETTEDSYILACGHSKWDCKGDCINCLYYCIDLLNKRLGETTQKLTLAESELLKRRNLSTEE